MREIKFRAWDKGYKRMSFKVNLYSLNKNGLIDHVQLDHKQIMNRIGFDCELMQFTGLKDKKGKDIYEGDIINDGNNTFAPVIWSQDECQFLVDYEFEAQELGSWCIVAGNIFENPDLIS